ncbi:hypothetical protein WMY93_028332 [Mugilogobius chulae]|uniref:Uncharacterized protein n=1 Tax=Mugilogobius chulae TaxID=88201 RepID=A0AAW0MN42_9GOBI
MWGKDFPYQVASQNSPWHLESAKPCNHYGQDTQGRTFTRTKNDPPYKLEGLDHDACARREVSLWRLFGVAFRSLGSDIASTIDHVIAKVVEAWDWWVQIWTYVWCFFRREEVTRLDKLNVTWTQYELKAKPAPYPQMEYFWGRSVKINGVFLGVTPLTLETLPKEWVLEEKAVHSCWTKLKLTVAKPVGVTSLPSAGVLNNEPPTPALRSYRTQMTPHPVRHVIWTGVSDEVLDMIFNQPTKKKSTGQNKTRDRKVNVTFTNTKVMPLRRAFRELGQKPIFGVVLGLDHKNHPFISTEVDLPWQPTADMDIPLDIGDMQKRERCWMSEVCSLNITIPLKGNL